MIDLGKFKTFNFDEGLPYVSITSNGLLFNKSVVMKMGYPAYIKLLINEDDKQIALQVCDEKDRGATAFYKKKASNVLSVRLNSKDLISTISRICGWDLEHIPHRVTGIPIPEESLMLFNLSEAIDME